MVAGVLASEDGGRLTGAPAGQHGVRPLPVVPGPGGGLKGDTEEVLSSIQRPAQFPKGDVPEWVHNAMEVAGIDISECCTPTNCQHDAMEAAGVDIAEFCPPTKCP
ncbi:hypothetical protein ZWY2020_017699 [Hordeum vulgare]|nr:hypothetical protein ZWY2020_017699 [Hordeum vulgare]